MIHRVFVPALLLILAAPASAQEPPRPAPTWADMMARGIIPYRQLTADDFTVNDTAQPKHNFYIKTAVSPQYHFIVKPYQGFGYAHIDQWMVFSGWDKNQTVRKRAYKLTKDDLVYAQAILDISELHARRIAALKQGELPSARGTTFEEARAELSRKLKEFLDATYKQPEAEVEKFMKSTGYGANKKKTRELAAEIRKRLDATPATTVALGDPQPGTTATAIPSPSPSGSPVASPTLTASPR